MTTTPTALRILQSTSVPKAVQNEIQSMILTGTLKAGQKLAEVALATRLGVSRGPVREAFRALEEAGLVRVSKNRGVFVRDISPTEAAELYEVRAGLDAMVGQILAARVTDAQLHELEGFLDRMDVLMMRGNLEDYFASNMRFHERIVEMAGNSKLLQIYRRLIDETVLMRRDTIYSGGGRLVSNQEHRRIVEAIASRDPDTAARAMREHVMAGRDRYMALLQSELAADGDTPPEAAAEPAPVDPVPRGAA